MWFKVNYRFFNFNSPLGLHLRPPVHRVVRLRMWNSFIVVAIGKVAYTCPFTTRSSTNADGTCVLFVRVPSTKSKNRIKQLKKTKGNRKPVHDL